MINKLLDILSLRPNYEERVFGLDLMRAIAILIVVMGHGLMLEYADTGFPWIKFINGVELFFVLSGFLIGNILIKTFEQTNNFNMKDIIKFWIRRWFRTLPNYYLVLMLNIIFICIDIKKHGFESISYKFFFFLQNLYRPFTGFFWESWSLTIEEWFYILFPLILLILSRISLREFLFINKINKKKIFLMSTMILFFAPILLRYIIANKIEITDNFHFDVKIYKVAMFRFDSIAFGIIGAYIKHWYSHYWFKFKNICFILGLIIIYTTLYTEWPPDAFYSKTILFSLQSFGCFLLLPKFDSIKSAPNLIRKIITHISLISYSMYLINLGLVAEVIRDNVKIETPTMAWVWYGIYWVIVLVASTLLYKYYEKPMMDLREKWA